MSARSRCFVVLFVALYLAATSLQAQDRGPLEQPPGESPSAIEPCNPCCCCGPKLWFQTDWLWTSHVSLSCPTPDFIAGPNAASFDDLPAFTGDNGYRFQGGVCLGNWIFEAVYSHFGDWESSLNRNVKGVAFNTAASSGKWAGENSINSDTYFTPIVNATSLTTPVNTAGDQSGLGPCAAFTTDPRPALMAYSHTDFYMTEANVKGADYVFPWFGRGWRLGAGYVNANLNNNSWMGLSGTFRAFNASGTTVSLPNSVLTSQTGGNLALYSGGGNGFTDGTSNVGTGTAGIPSQLFFTHSANTRNELNGAQVVLDGNLLEFHHFDFGANLKAGIFDNFAQGSIVETYATTNNDLSAYARRFSNSCHQMAFLGGLGVDVGYHVTDEIAIRTGYDVLYLSNLALGPEQVSGISNSWYHVQTNGTACIQSVHAGLEITF